LRKGSFLPSILERRRRIDLALFAVVMEAYVQKVSTCKVDDLVVALGAASGISKSEVSRICSELDAEMGAFRARRLDHAEFPYLFADATYLKGRADVVGVFPNDHAIERLVTAVIVEAHDEWAVSERHYLSETSMAKLRQNTPPLSGTAPKRRQLAS
jgi:transposase-like protein